MKAYVLTAEGYFEGYGSETYLLGVFTDLDKLSAAQDEYVQLVRDACEYEDDDEIKDRYTQVDEVELDTAYPLKPACEPDPYEHDEKVFQFSNKKGVGGYIE